MGLYPISCTGCGKGFLWFSGNLDQRCDECRNKPLNGEPYESKCSECGKVIKTAKPVTADVIYCSMACACH